MPWVLAPRSPVHDVLVLGLLVYHILLLDFVLICPDQRVLRVADVHLDQPRVHGYWTRIHCPVDCLVAVVGVLDLHALEVVIQ